MYHVLLERSLRLLLNVVDHKMVQIHQIRFVLLHRRGGRPQLGYHARIEKVQFRFPQRQQFHELRLLIVRSDCNAKWGGKEGKLMRSTDEDGSGHFRFAYVFRHCRTSGSQCSPDYSSARRHSCEHCNHRRARKSESNWSMSARNDLNRFRSSIDYQWCSTSLTK